MSIEGDRAEKKAQGWDWIAAECRRVLDEIRAARDAEEVRQGSD